MSDRGEHPVQKLAGAADKGLADPVFLAARRFADDQERGVDNPVIDDRVAGPGFKRTALKGGDGGGELFNAVRAIGRVLRKANRLIRRRRICDLDRFWRFFLRDGSRGRGGFVRLMPSMTIPTPEDFPAPEDEAVAETAEGEAVEATTATAASEPEASATANPGGR